MTNTLIGLLSAGVLAVGGLAAAAGLGDSDPARTVSIPVATSTADTTTGETTTAAKTTVENEVEDVSGPCDEAEHANDPHCTGGTTSDEDDDDRSGSNRGSDVDEDDGDRSGSNRGSDDDDDHHDDSDRSGSNSGRG